MINENELAELLGPEPVPALIEQRIKFADRTAGGAPKPTMANAIQCIEALDLECRQDVFSGQYTVNGSQLQSFAGNLSDPVARKVRMLSRAKFGLDPGKENTNDALKRACEERRFHPIMDYLDGLKWDGVKRLDTWLSTYLGVEDTPLTRAQGRIVLMAAVRRIYEPGCKFDSVLVLEGPEGAYKSSVVKVLASGSRTNNLYSSDSPILNTDERQQQELTAGVWFYEIAELAGMRRGDQFAIKNFITKQEERARPAYAEFIEIRPRVCVFIGTFNNAAGGAVIEYLNVGDQRRWWPIIVGNIDIPALERDRDQLFGEAMCDYGLGIDCDLYLPAGLEKEAKGVAKTREKIDPLADTYSSIYEDVLRMAQPPAKDSVMLTTDGKPVTRQETDASVMLVKGEEAQPFAVVMADGVEAWVSAKYVGELAPPSRKNDGSGIASAMRSLGWCAVQDRRSGSKARGWLLTGPERESEP